MDIKMQKILEKKYIIKWKDAEDFKIISKSQETINDPYIKSKIQGMIFNQDPYYYTFNYQPLIDVVNIKPSPLNAFQNKGTEKIYNDHTILEIPDHIFFFKGMKTFYDYDSPKNKEIAKVEPRWFANEQTALRYAKIYHGGLNVYKPKRSIKLLVFTNYNNIKKIIKFFDKKNPKSAFSIKMKTGVDISLFTQIDYYMKYHKYEDLWLIKNAGISPNTGQKIPIIKGIYLWGRGWIDRIVANALCIYCHQNNFDGYISYESYSPYLNLVEEMVLCEYQKILERNRSHPLDWTNWRKYLPVNIDDNLVLDDRGSFKNNNFQVFRFWDENRMTTNHNKKIHLKIKKLKNKFVFSTFNIHSFYSFNMNNSKEFSFRKFILMLNFLKIDLICLQEIEFTENFNFDNIKNILAKEGYDIHYIEAVKDFGNAIISKFPINIIKNITLENDPKFKMVRKATFFKIKHEIVHNYIFCTTHLEIGDRYMDRVGNLYSENSLKEIIENNSQLRIKQLQQITKENPDIILGDLNFNPDDLEFEYINKKYITYMKHITETTPFKTVTDYIFYKRNANIKPPYLSEIINYRYSDHLPVINVLS